MAETPRRAAALQSAPPVRATAPIGGPFQPPSNDERPAEIPQRYAIREKDGVRTLECDEAPRLRVILDPAMAASKSDAAALGDRVILLDGAGTFGPLLDNDRKLYNLDHHQGCERLFTLATCEQALLLVHSGLDLSEGDWRLYANDPDLDTSLALWCLLNHRRLRELRPEARDVLLPLLRLEGATDANGPELARLCGLPSDVLDQTQARIDELLVQERELKQAGAWSKKDVYAYTLEMLREIDAMVYMEEDFGDYTRIEEVYGHVEVAPRRVAVVCRDRSGIYTVEQHLKTHWGDQLSIIALENQPGHYTLRRLSSLAGPGLQPAYELLNRIDPAVDGRPPGKRWGGSHDIGGSPRPRGTQLSSAEMIEILGRAYRNPGWWARTVRTAAAFGLGLAYLLFWKLAGALPSLASLALATPAVAAAFELTKVSLLALAVGTVALRAASRWRPWVFGWRSPAPGRWWMLSLVVVVCAVPVRGWVPIPLGVTTPEIFVSLLAGALAVTAAEVWFRGFVHGLLSFDFPIQYPGGPRLLSRAVVVSSLAYAIVATAITAPALPSPGLALLGLDIPGQLGVVAACALAAALALGVIRELSLSIRPGIGLQVLGALASAAVWLLLA
jgi:hypothetical protein